MNKYVPLNSTGLFFPVGLHQIAILDGWDPCWSQGSPDAARVTWMIKMVANQMWKPEGRGVLQHPHPTNDSIAIRNRFRAIKLERQVKVQGFVESDQEAEGIHKM